MWVLGAVFVALALLILPYFQKWLVQRSEIEQTRAEVAQSQRAVDDLKKQRSRWADDEYVKAQARSRLRYVMPGEKGFAVIDPKPAPAPARPGEASGVPEGNRPWYSDIWLSAQVAAEAPAK
jgi:septum formation initiator